MGTRHVIAVVQKEEFKVAQYGQWDGYPGGQGLDILKFLTHKDTDFELFKEEISKCRFITDIEGDEVQEKLCNLSEQQIEKYYPQFDRNTGAGILNVIYEGKAYELSNYIKFVEDSLFCEWAYVIDLDKETLEVFGGFNKEKLDESERFFNDGIFDVKLYEPYDVYYPVKLIHTFDLNNLPTQNEFLNILEPEDDEE